MRSMGRGSNVAIRSWNFEGGGEGGEVGRSV